MAGWSFLVFTAVVFLDSFFINKLENETVIKLEEKLEYVRTGGKYGRSVPRSYFELETENLDFRISPLEVVELAIKPGDQLIYWRTYIFRQRIFLAVNGQGYSYLPIAESPFRNLFWLQGAIALIGLLAFIPGQVRVMAIVISGLLTTFSLLIVLAAAS